MFARTVVLQRTASAIRYGALENAGIDISTPENVKNLSRLLDSAAMGTTNDG
jgi:hypothetical protein